MLENIRHYIFNKKTVVADTEPTEGSRHRGSLRCSTFFFLLFNIATFFFLLFNIAFTSLITTLSDAHGKNTITVIVLNIAAAFAASLGIKAVY